MTGIVARLREKVAKARSYNSAVCCHPSLFIEAADEIERLRASNAELLEALKTLTLRDFRRATE